MLEMREERKTEKAEEIKRDLTWGKKLFTRTFTQNWF